MYIFHVVRIKSESVIFRDSCIKFTAVLKKIFPLEFYIHVIRGHFKNI